MPTTIYFIRHGETNTNKLRVFHGADGSHLTDNGINQVIQTCHKITEANLKWNVIISSPYLRAKQTTDIITSFFPRRKPVIYSDLIVERSFGSAEGVSITKENYQKIMNNEFSDLETEEQIIKRAQQFIKQIQQDYFGKSILVVTHSHFLKACFMPYLDNLRFDTKTLNAGVSVLVFNEFNNLKTAKIDIFA